MKIVTGGVLGAILVMAGSANAQTTVRLGEAKPAAVSPANPNGQAVTQQTGIISGLAHLIFCFGGRGYYGGWGCYGCYGGWGCYGGCYGGWGGYGYGYPTGYGYGYGGYGYGGYGGYGYGGYGGYGYGGYGGYGYGGYPGGYGYGGFGYPGCIGYGGYGYGGYGYGGYGYGGYGGYGYPWGGYGYGYCAYDGSSSYSPLRVEVARFPAATNLTGSVPPPMAPPCSSGPYSPGPYPPASANPQTTYPYDGGPANPVPMPGAAPRAVSPSVPQEPRTIPRDGFLVSLPTQTTGSVHPILFGASQSAPAASAPPQKKYVYKAYGE